MFADDTQIINKHEDSPKKKSFNILSTYEKASVSKIHLDKTKGLYMDTVSNRRPTFTNIK